MLGRYEITRVLGEGGMGRVYQARDTELDRLVAIKVIKPSLLSSPAMLQRFRQELILARQVTHRNVIRIYDIGEANGLKFITMEFIEGEDLRSLIFRKGKLGPEEASEIMTQALCGLEAAHEQGVIHRDLKPGNIMREASGRVVVMDFGLARSDDTRMTQTGQLLGTPEYMSPEQALGQELDGRSDLFSAGLIFYEALTGDIPFKADSAIASLLKRTRERATPVSKMDASVPPKLSVIVDKCLETEKNKRYQTAAEMIAALDAYRGVRHRISFVPSRVTVTTPRRPWPIILTAVCVLIAAAAGVWYFVRGRAPSGPHAPISVLIADFSNHTGDPVFDNTLEPMLNLALEGASFVNGFNRGEAHKLAKQLPHPSSVLDEQSARLVAVSQGVSAVVIGSLSRRGDGYKLTAEAIDAASGNSLGSADVNVASKDEVSLAIPKLAAPLRRALGDRTPESAQLESERGAFTAASLEVVHQYGLGMDMLFGGNMEGAFQSFTKAAELDPNFARAYSGMAAAAGNLNRSQDSQKYLQLAMEHVDRMTERERYRIRGLYYRRIGDMQKCIEEYGQLIKLYPADNIGHQNLANCYSDLHMIDKALAETEKAVEIVPKAAMQRRNLALFAAYAGDGAMAEREARASLQINPAYDKAYLTLAYAQILQGQLSQAGDTYRQLDKVSPLGASFASSGLADLAIYEGRYSDAVRMLLEGAKSDQLSTNLLAGEKYAALAYVELVREHRNAALDYAEKALANTKKANVRFLVARISVAAGEMAKARSIAESLAAEPRPEPQADAKLIEGEIAFQGHNLLQAINTFIEANHLVDTWIGRFDLGRAYLEAGQFAEADSEFDRCIKRRGEALELFDGPTYGYFPVVYYYQGRVREGLKSQGAADSYRTYLGIRGQSSEDPLVSEIHRKGIH
jgi:tetratricopeptide (TPR) repeat protein